MPRQALLEDSVLLLEILDYLKLMTAHPTGEHQQADPKRQRERGHRSRLCPAAASAAISRL
jgi:hypothetical protein